jgi:hypothetical protein
VITAADRTTARPPGAEQLIRRTGVGRRLFPVEKLEHWAANPRLPYTVSRRGGFGAGSRLAATTSTAARSTR